MPNTLWVIKALYKDRIMERGSEGGSRLKRCTAYKNNYKHIVV